MERLYLFMSKTEHTRHWEPWECHLEDVVLVGDEVRHYEGELGCGEEAGHLVVIGIPGQPGLDYELVRTVNPLDQTLPADPHTGHADLLHPRRTSEAGVGPQPGTVALDTGQEEEEEVGVLHG